MEESLKQKTLESSQLIAKLRRQVEEKDWEGAMDTKRDLASMGYPIAAPAPEVDGLMYEVNQ